MMSLRTMRLLVLATVCLAASLSGQAPTTIILVRHAEKAGDPSERDPELSEAGRERAEALAHVLGEVAVSAIYSTPFLRTRHSVEPLAEQLGVEITVTPVGSAYVADLAERLRNDHAGEVVLVVSHSNTVPPIINALGAGPFENLAEDEYDDLFVVTLTPGGGASALRLRYGRETP